jgi:uncharacterized Zn finger protein
MKFEIKCVKCNDTEQSTDVLKSLKAFYNPCEDCGSKQEVKFVEYTTKGRN